MKKILIIDDSRMIREFLNRKLEEFGFETDQASNGLEGYTKLRSYEPDLIIMDYYLSRMGAVEFLTKKAGDPNSKNTPVLFASAKISREVILELSKFGIKKFITKPIKIDSLAKSVSELLNVKIELDNTPCIIDANYNEEILFIEVARGLNSEKIEMLRYRLQELIKLYSIQIPRVLLMMSGIEISEGDSLKLRSLIDGIISATDLKLHNFKILTNNDLVKKFVSSRSDIASVEVFSSMPDAMDALLGDKAGGYKDKNGNVHDDFLRVGRGVEESSDGINLRFQSEQNDTQVNFDAIASGLKMAVVDDDPVIQELISMAFSKTQLDVQTFSNGEEFINSQDIESFDMVFLDLLMPRMDGFSVLTALKSRGIQLPIIVLSAVNKRETVIQALQMGVKSYLVKPIQPDMVFKKALEIFQMNF